MLSYTSSARCRKKPFRAAIILAGKMSANARASPAFAAVFLAALIKGHKKIALKSVLLYTITFDFPCKPCIITDIKAKALRNKFPAAPLLFYLRAAVRYLSPDGERQPAGGQRAHMNCIAVRCRLYSFKTRIDPQQKAGLPGSGFFGQWSPDSK